MMESGSTPLFLKALRSVSVFVLVSWVTLGKGVVPKCVQPCVENGALIVHVSSIRDREN